MSKPENTTRPVPLEFVNLPRPTRQERRAFQAPLHIRMREGVRSRIFGDRPELPEPPQIREVVADPDDSIIKSLTMLKERLQIPDDARVVYPGSDTHVGAATVFGKENVTHVDPDESAALSLAKYGYLAKAENIEDHMPTKGPYDVMFALNSYGQLDREGFARLVKPGGLILANNYTHWAHDIPESGIELVGAILPNMYAEEAEYTTEAAKLKDSTDIVHEYIRISPGGKVELFNEPTPGAFADESARYPDALFVFQMP